jgi:hypothetical protein
MKLTAEQKALLETQFPAKLEKEAAAEVAKIQELYSVGFEKMAAEAAESMDKEEEEEEEEDKKDLSEEQEKEASARAAFIARGYIDGLMKQGSERHNDELHYLYPAIEEKLAAMDMSKVRRALTGAKLGLKENIRKAVTGEKYRNIRERAIKGSQMAKTPEMKDKMKKLYLKGSLSAKQRAMEAGKALAKTSPATGLAGYGVYKATKKDK